MISPTSLEDTPTPPILGGALFMRRLQIATYGLLLFVLIVYLLDRFRDILQPLFVALFLGFLLHPVHRRLVRHGVRSGFAYGIILTLVMLSVWGVGSMVYADVAQVAEKMPDYRQRYEATIENRIEATVHDLIGSLPFEVPGLKGHFLRDINIDGEQLRSTARDLLGRFGDFSSLVALTFIYLLFLIADKVSFPKRLTLAFGPQKGAYFMGVVESINQAISDYIVVKTLVSALAGFLSYLVLATFGVDFAPTWGILIFVLNYIPYLGSLIAVALPIALSFVQFDEIWKGTVITVLLIGIQQVIGTLVEPRMAGQRLDVSPLLILLSLAFWGVVWGIIGMILAVPLLVIVKIILDNIPETKPIATLISNR